MSTTPAVIETVVPEVPPEVKERQETDAYIAEREKQKAEPPPPVTFETTTPAEAAGEPAKVEAIPEADQQAVDAYIRERDYKKKQGRKQRGGVQARIDELTKKTAELEAKVIVPVVEAPKVEETKVIQPVVEVPKAAPKMAEYSDVEKYNADMALWAAAQTKNIPPQVPAEVPKPDPVRQAEMDRFLENGRKFMVNHPDFNQVLQAAEVRGLTMSEQARLAITTLGAPEVVYWLARPENDLAARSLMKMDGFQQSLEIGKIAERLTVRPSDFVSNAPPPGQRLNGTTNAVAATMQELAERNETDEYLRQRRQLKRAGRGR